MDRLPLEVIWNILSRLGDAHNVVVASAVCKKWREAWRKHLHTLSFNINDWHAYGDLATGWLEILITRTVIQTTGLQGLCIFLGDDREFSAPSVIAWLTHIRETLRVLQWNVRTTLDVNILEICGRRKLETLMLYHNLISGVEPNFQRFPCLKSLSLFQVRISALDLRLLLIACPRLEKLELVSPMIQLSDAHAAMQLSSPTLKSIYVSSISLYKFILEADSIEYLHMNCCALELFELIGKGALKHFKIDDASIRHCYISKALDYLEVVDVSDFKTIWPTFYQIISKSSRLRKLRVWKVVFNFDYVSVDLENVAVCFPQLNHLALSYGSRDGQFQYGLQGSTHLEKVTVLELGWNVIGNRFSIVVEGLLKHCPNLKRLLIHAVVSDLSPFLESQMLGDFTSEMVQLMREYNHVDVCFKYK